MLQVGACLKIIVENAMGFKGLKIRRSEFDIKRLNDPRYQGTVSASAAVWVRIVISRRSQDISVRQVNPYKCSGDNVPVQ